MTLGWCIHLQHSHDGIVCEVEQRITNGFIRNLLLVAVVAGKAGQGLEAGKSRAGKTMMTAIRFR